MSMTLGPKYAAWSSSSHGGGFGNHTVVDNVPPEMRYLVDAHWYQFPPMNPLWFGILGFIMTCLATVSVSGNGMVIYIFMTTKTLRTPSNFFVVNLAMSDFGMMFCMVPPLVINCYYQTWVLGPMFCQIYALLGSQFGCVSIWCMTLIAFDRYNVIVKGLAGKPLTVGGALLQILAINIFSGLWTVAPMFGWSRYVPEGNMTACGTDYLSKDWLSRSYILAYSVACYYLPLFLIIYSYFFIIQAVAAHEKAMREQAKKMNVTSLRSSADNQATSAEIKLAKVAMMTISLWVMAWTPYLVINYAGVFETMKIPPLFTIWGSLFAKANAVYNPIVYGISHPKYRAALHARFPSLACGGAERGRGGDATSTVSGTTTVTDNEKSNA